MNIHYSELVGHKNVMEAWDFYAGRHTKAYNVHQYFVDMNPKSYVSAVTYPYDSGIRYAWMGWVWECNTVKVTYLPRNNVSTAKFHGPPPKNALRGSFQKKIQTKIHTKIQTSSLN